MSTIALHPTSVRRPSRPRNESGIEASAPLRLTRRGRIVVGALFLVMLLAVAVAFGARSAATGETGTPVPTRTVVVGSGDTLWGIASEIAEPGHTRAMMQQIEDLNALSSSTLQPGQELAVPVR
ncbi:MAG: LysM peptidoglycan-binding domain-containing protein [Nocardioidaceae bacterium]